jgi:hypothetical protein
LLVLIASVCAAQAKGDARPDEGTRKLAFDIYKELIEINTTASVGSTTVGERMQRRLPMRDLR